MNGNDGAAMTLRLRFTLAMLAVTAIGILLSAGIILYASTQTILAKSKDALLVSCESILAAYESFVHCLHPKGSENFLEPRLGRKEDIPASRHVRLCDLRGEDERAR